MADTVRYFHAYNGTKLEYSATENGTYKQIACITQAPDIGGEPNTIDTTNLDNTEYESAILGLKPVQTLTFEFNLEDPTVTSNIYLASQLEDADEVYYWKYTLSNGIVITFQSKVKTTILGGGSADLLKFSMTLTPEGGVINRDLGVES